ncbi:TPA: ATP-binding protein, partial [Acinetobacter baumannii]|nr:ATP-binding protein [Acinetobacter baumannii]
KHLLQKTRGGLYNIGCRIIFPAWGIFRELSIKDKISWADIYRYSSYKSDLLILPLNFKYNLTDEKFYEESEDFVNWIFEHRKYEGTKIEDIRKLNKELIEHIRKILQDSDLEEENIKNESDIEVLK